MHRPPFPVSFAFVLMMVALVGCRSTPKHFAFRGLVVGKSSNQLTVNAQDIPGFMAAMTMPYPVKDPEAFEKIQPGDAITANLIVAKDKSYWLENAVVVGHASGTTADTATHVEEEESSSVLGMPVPDVPMVNQDGKTIRLSDFKGKSVLVTFTYTRCPFPNFCPAISNEFASIQRELSKTPEFYKKTHLVSISLDPANDTPAVMREYGLSRLDDHAGGFAHWDFVATKPEDLKALAAAFGLTYYSQDSLITHTMRTVLVTPQGTIANIWDGSEWRQPELLDAIIKQLASASS
jgi:protein SCO1/2